ncbi:MULTISPECIES: CAP domain-containing protein [unclassified Streptomyces]|uniref:CAP domain-containing protein n=1 Tax=unclassified Streptomyces TaxID=2593676 RepID=UPI003813AA3A
MGRHRRSAGEPAPADLAEGSDGRSQGGSRRKKRASVPVRTGLLGVSAAVAVGAVAVASGLLPGGGTYKVSGDTMAGGRLDPSGTPNVQAQGGESEKPTSAAPTPAETAKAAHLPSTAPSPSASATPSAPASAPPAPRKPPAPAPSKPAPSKPVTAPVVPSVAPSTVIPQQRVQAPTAEAAAAATVMSLVNQQRAQAGCMPVKSDAALASLATAFSDDMAARGFFDHTDPDGKSPWDRAAKAGIQGLGGENIARGQADAKAVMDAWMNSPGHRANILNCEYKSLGVGVHFGPGGPWWTQDFGF